MPKPVPWPDEAPYWDDEPGGAIRVPVTRGQTDTDAWDAGPMLVTPTDQSWDYWRGYVEETEAIMAMPRTAADDDLDVIRASEEG